MAEKTSKVYDIMHPTPVSLQDLSVIAVGLELWRSEINEFRQSQTLERFWVLLSVNKASITSLRTKLPELPPAIYDVIVEYVTRLGKSIAYFVGEHIRTVMFFKNRFQGRLSEVLEYFDDFVLDYNGTVDLVKTAERMMRCDSFDDVLKFIVACRYFLEDHVRRIWPSVRQKMHLSRIDFEKNPQLYYWICYLSNQLNKIPIYEYYDTVDEQMLEECAHMCGNRLAINHFWNRIPHENQMRMAIELLRVKKKECFVRFILPKLDDQQLEEFVNAKGSDLMQAVLVYHSHDERFIFQTWMYVKSLMNDRTFSSLVVSMLRTEAGYFPVIVHQKLKNWLHQCRPIWNSVPHNLKRSVIINISSDLELTICQIVFRSTRATSSEFLLFILSHFTSEEKQSFWRNCWKNLIMNKNTRDLQRIMEVCFEHENDITKFKENVIAESENLHLSCALLLNCANFIELDALVNFSCPRSAETAKRSKQRTLQWSLISPHFHFYRCHVLHWEEFNTFINNAYDSIDLANDYKHQLVYNLRVVIVRVMSDCVLMQEAYAVAVRKFIETFVLTEPMLQQIKSSIIDRLKENAIRCCSTIEYVKSEPFLEQFLLWCLGSNEQVMAFRIMLHLA